MSSRPLLWADVPESLREATPQHNWRQPDPPCIGATAMYWTDPVHYSPCLGPPVTGTNLCYPHTRMKQQRLEKGST